MRRARAHSEQDRAAVLAILEEFFTVENGRYSNARLAREFSAANDAHERRKVAGSKGGRAKSLKKNDSKLSKAVAKPKQPEPEPEPDKEVDKSTSSQEVADYQRFMDAHPKPVESIAGEKAFRSLIDAGENVEQIIAAAKKYSETVKSWSGDGRVQQSDNFLSADRGKWKDYTPKPKAPVPSYQDKLKFWANSINDDKYIPKVSVNQKLARDMIEAGLVSSEKMKERGIAS